MIAQLSTYIGIDPVIGHSATGDILYSWANAEHYFECLICPNGRVEFFYRNRESLERWVHNVQKGELIPAQVWQYGSRFQ